MIKNKITILILSTLITINSYSNVVIVKDSPNFINTSEKINTVERHLYSISDVDVKKLEDIKKEQIYLLSFADLSFNDDSDFPSETNKPDFDITSKNLLKVHKKYNDIIEEYEMLDEIESEIRYEKMNKLMKDVFSNEKELNNIQEKIDFLKEKTAPYLKLEKELKNKIKISKNKINDSQDSVIKYVDEYILINDIKEKSIKKINLNRVKKIENKCPISGFNPKANNAMVSFYYIQIEEYLCLSTSLPSLSFKTLSLLMNDKGFLDIYNKSLVILAEENLKIGNWTLRHSYTVRDYKTQMKEIQKITRPAIREIEDRVGYSKSNLNIKKNRILKIIEDEQDLIDYEMIDFDNEAFDRKKEAAEFIIFDDYIKTVNIYILDKISEIYEIDHTVNRYVDYETIELEEIDSSVVIVVDYLDNNAEIFYVNQDSAYKHRFDVNYGWNKSSLLKLEEKNALKSNVVPIDSNMLTQIIEKTFNDIASE